MSDFSTDIVFNWTRDLELEYFKARLDQLNVDYYSNYLDDFTVIYPKNLKCAFKFKKSGEFVELMAD